MFPSVLLNMFPSVLLNMFSSVGQASRLPYINKNNLFRKEK